MRSVRQRRAVLPIAALLFSSAPRCVVVLAKRRATPLVRLMWVSGLPPACAVWNYGTQGVPRHARSIWRVHPPVLDFVERRVLISAEGFVRTLMLVRLSFTSKRLAHAKCATADHVPPRPVISQRHHFVCDLSSHLSPREYTACPPRFRPDLLVTAAFLANPCAVPSAVALVGWGTTWRESAKTSREGNARAALGRQAAVAGKQAREKVAARRLQRRRAPGELQTIRRRA